MTRLRTMVAGSSLTGGAVLAGLVLLGGLVPANAQARTWSVVPSPSPGFRSSLSAVSCVSAAACTAVGEYRASGNARSRTLVESWNGARWSVVPSPNRGIDDYLDGVSCVSAAVCTAVGGSENRGDTRDRALIESWNGTRWSVVPSPSRGSYDYLFGVSCVSPAACTAVGNSSSTSEAPSKTLIESWNGTRWSVVPSPSPGSGKFSGNYLDGVSCVSAAACTAVGEYQLSGNAPPYKTLIESWNGARWSVVPSPSPSSTASYLSGVSCISAAACTAAGYYNTSTGPERQDTLIESWNGTRWSVVPSPSLYAPNYLEGVSCVSPAACVAVGVHQAAHAAHGSKALIESWNGTRWSVVPSPSPSPGYNILFAVSCASTACMAAGDSSVGSLTHRHPKTLVESGPVSG